MSIPNAKLAKLTKEVKLAERTFKNALVKRSEIRKSFLTKVNSKKAPRRPIGAPADFKIPAGSGSSVVKPAKKEMRMYMGPIIGTITLKGYSGPLPGKDPTADFGYDILYDKIQLDMFWRAKINYQNKQEQLIKYIRKHHAGRAKEEINQAVNLQILGCNSDDALSQGRTEIAELCDKVWKIYKNVPEPRPMDIKKLLVKSIEEAQYVGMSSDDYSTLGEMENELSRLIDIDLKTKKAKEIQILLKKAGKNAKINTGAAFA